VIVKSGSFTLYDSEDPTCTGTTYPAGKVFVDSGYGHVHIGRTEGETFTELYVTYLDGGRRAADRRAWNCSF
jgi:hypothetical protein